MPKLKTMEEAPWPRKLQALTHTLVCPTSAPPLSSQFFMAAQVPCYLNWDYPPLLCPKPSLFPLLPLHLQWAFSLFLKRASRFGLPKTSWRSKCPFQLPPPLILAKGLDAARWGDQHRTNYATIRLRRKRLVSHVNPLIPIMIPNLLLFSLLLWNPLSSTH